MSDTQKQKNKGPVIIPKKVYDWARKTSYSSPVNNFKVGGGRPSWNGGK
ncbi:hypothetical protein [Brevibacillus choshinensis]|uniref:Uncharacterized protein n=1 Tax=Brevibacillus choshinensis TaxID=54911 RepID=A0ABX7FHQ3_BRECH|nr:hypothetical protein [Brevibacillus choshinensis]QRG65274.1 hypothetical protein JNE38_16660 [Brevibacillus choshinensis]